jgi:hypothetical protein
MATQIATAFRTQGPESAAEAAYDHIWQFWSPRMRRMIVDHLASSGEGLNDIARGAVTRLAARLSEQA